jgi:hypothetical protein
MHRSYSKEHLIKVLYMAEIGKKPVISGAISAKKDVPYYNFYALMERGHNFQQLSCRTYALTPYGSKVMVHEVFYSQYQGYEEKIL